MRINLFFIGSQYDELDGSLLSSDKQEIELLKKEYKTQISILSEEIEETKEKSQREIRGQKLN
jgi:hypothetical protein